MALLLLIGNKNYSSWSLRPWIAMKVAGIPFEEQVISLDAADFKERVHQISAAGKVPALAGGTRLHGGGDGAAGLGRLVRRRPGGAMGAAERRGRLADRAPRVTINPGLKRDFLRGVT